jgi:hypothetical protein
MIINIQITFLNIISRLRRLYAYMNIYLFIYYIPSRVLYKYS